MSTNPKEYENLNLSYDRIVQMLDRGIVKKIRGKSTTKPFKFGFRGGHYLGAPGKDIFLFMPDFTEEQFLDIAKRTSNLFPSKAPDNHLHWAAYIRYVYGCFEKQGCLRSKSDKKRMMKENPDWELPMRFMDVVFNHFKKNGNKYGMVLHYEMLGHRYGDRAIIDKNPKYLDTMMNYYIKSQNLAVKIKSYKHMFSPYYWGAHYFYEMGDMNNAAKYHWANIKCMERYCPDARPGYREKAVTSIRQLKRSLNGSPQEWKKKRQWILKCKNVCLSKVKRKAK